jgi:hypothetical protein
VVNGVPSAAQPLLLSTATATHFAVTAATHTAVGAALSVTVKALDASGNLFPGYTGTVHLTSTDNQAVISADTTLASGVGTFAVTLKTIGTQSITATDTATSTITGTQVGITVQAVIGGACSLASDCASGAPCVDGRCCDSACTGQCEACDVAGQEGACTAVTGTPHSGRTSCADDQSGCGGACNGTQATACAYPTSQCRSGSCDATSEVAILAGSCDGQGHCPAQQTAACAPYVCGVTTCAGNCTSDSQCAAADSCAAGVCIPRLAQGAACSATDQCGTGFCVDGVCCESACQGQCEACGEAAKEGTCVAVAGAPRDGRAACGGVGICHGQCGGTVRTECDFPGAATVCTAAACTGGTATSAETCNGSGTCRPGMPVFCGAYVCGGATCKTSCTNASDCAAGLPCNNGVCGQAAASSGCGSTGDQPGIMLWLTLAWLLVCAARNKGLAGLGRS